MITEVQAREAAQKISSAVGDTCMAEEDIYADLMAINSEETVHEPGRFQKIVYSQRYNLLKITTEPIVLEGAELGQFEIRFKVGDDYYAYSNYCEIRPLQRNPHAPRNHSHPHLSGRKLCFGSGGQAAYNAMNRGDVTSVARIVNAALHVYNASSPYATIDKFFGPDCFDCGGTVVRNPYDAQRLKMPPGIVCPCGRQTCGHCKTTCLRCRSNSCAECIGTIADGTGRVHNYCRSCSIMCAGCEAVRVPNTIEFRYTDRQYGYARQTYRCVPCLAKMTEHS